MFNRSARNALNASAGIQSFSNGGGVFNTVFGNLAQRPVASNIQNQILTQQAANQQAASLGSNLRRPSGTIITGLDGNKYFVPSKAASPSQRGLLDIASQAIQEGFGSLNPLQSGALGALEGGESARKVSTPITDYLGDSTLSSIVGAGADVAGQIGGGLAGGLSSLAASDDGDTSTLSGRLGTVMPGDATLEALGIFKFPSYSAEDETAIPEPKSAIELGIPVSPTGLGGVFAKDVTTEFDTPMPRNMFDEAGRKRLEQERLARKAMEESGVVDIDEETGEVTAVDPPPKPVKVSAAKDPLASMVDDSGAAEQAPGLLKEEIEEDGSSENQESQENSAAEQASQVDIGVGPEPRPSNFQDIVNQAKQANSDLPKDVSPQDSIDIARERGTNSPEDLKAEFLSLLPKYEEDKTTMGLNIAMMGFAIAGGKSSSAIENIANGMKETLPKLIKSKEKRKAFERETELVAAKYAIQRTEDDRKQDRLKNTYFVTKEFTDPTTGEKYDVGQPIRLNDAAFDIAQEQGLTKNLTTPTLMSKILDAKNEKDKGLSYKEINALYDRVSREFNGIKYEVLTPTEYGRTQGRTTAKFSSDNDLNAVSSQYVNELDKLLALDKGIQTARGLVQTGDAVGIGGVIGKISDGLRGAGGDALLKSVGFKDDQITKLSTAGQYERVHGILAMQLAPILLGEAGKTISDADRVRVATALGYEANLVDGRAVIKLTGGIQNLFQSKEAADFALQEIQSVLRDRAEVKHKEYSTLLSGFGMSLEQRTITGDTPDAILEGSGVNLVLGEDGVFDIVGTSS
jgi:hypothetical protein